MNDTTMSEQSPSTRNGLSEWRRIATQRDWPAFADLLVEEVEYRNPASIEPIRGREATVAVFAAVFSVMEDFEYHREYNRDGGVALEFTAKVGDDPVVGIDLIDFNEDGKITDFAVMMRPAPTVLTLASEALKRLPPA